METGIIILLAALALGVILFAAGYLKAPPDTAFIISGLGKKRILIGKAGWRIPFLERVDKLSLQVMTGGRKDQRGRAHQRVHQRDGGRRGQREDLLRPSAAYPRG